MHQLHFQLDTEWMRISEICHQVPGQWKDILMMPTLKSYIRIQTPLEFPLLAAYNFHR